MVVGLLDLAAIALKPGAPPATAEGGSPSMTWQPVHQCSASVPPTPGPCAAGESGSSSSNAIAIFLRICFTVSRQIAALISKGRLALARVFSFDFCQSGRIGAIQLQHARSTSMRPLPSAAF